MVDKIIDTRKLTLARIIVPVVGTTDKVQDKDDGSSNAYIMQYQEYVARILGLRTA